MVRGREEGGGAAYRISEFWGGPPAAASNMKTQSAITAPPINPATAPSMSNRVLECCIGTSVQAYSQGPAAVGRLATIRKTGRKSKWNQVWRVGFPPC